MIKLSMLALAGMTIVHAGIIGAPPDPANGNGYPFGSPNFIGRYQQIYSATAFPGPITILAIGFFHTQIPTGHFTGQTFTFSFSTTSKPVNSLDLNNASANVGSDSALFAATTLSGVAPVGELLISGTPFTYNPALGNLLLNIGISGLGDPVNDLYMDARNGTAGGLFSRAMYLPNGQIICCGNDNYGLTTDFVSLPEPSEIPVLIAVLASGFFVRRTARRRA